MAGYYVTRHVVQPGVGLVAEAIAHRKAKKSQREEVEEVVASQAVVLDDAKLASDDKKASGETLVSTQQVTMTTTTISDTGDEPPPPYREVGIPQNEEQDPDTKNAQLQKPTTSFEAMQIKQPSPRFVVPKGNAFGPASIKSIVEAFIAGYPPISTSHRLKASAVLPQRRPGDPSRSFVHAYAPLLQDVGISQSCWLDFLGCFEESLKITPAFDVFNYAVGILGLIGHFVPDPFTRVATIALTVAEETAKATYQRIRANSFFAEINEKFFMPLGLYCLVMTYNPYARAVSQSSDISGQVAKAHGFEKKLRAYMKRNLGGVSATTHGEVEMPETAPLVYPDREGDQDTEGKKANRFTRSRQFVDEYLDKRARSRFAADNPDSVLAQEPEFESSLGSFGTRHQHAGRGGPIGAPLSRVVEWASDGKYKGRAANPIVMATRAVRPKALYLMVTSLPTAEEREAVRECLDFKNLSDKEAEEFERESEDKEE